MLATCLSPAFLMILLATDAAQPAAGLAQYVLGVLGSVLSVVVPWAISAFVKNQNAQKALTIIAHAAGVGVSSAWGTYTSKAKDASTDGTLTDAEKEQARAVAWNAALAAMGDDGKRAVMAWGGSGWEEALKHAIEGAYQERKPGLEGSQ